MKPTCLFRGSRFHNRHGQIAALQHLAVQGVHAHLRGEDLGLALAAEEDDPLVKDAQALYLHRTGAGAVSVQGHTVEEAHIHRIEAAVEDHRLHINVRIEQLRLAALHSLGPAVHIQTSPRGIEAEILDTVLIVRYNAL